MAVNRIQANGTAPSPDRQDFNIAAGAGITITAADDSTNNVSKATVAIGGAAADAPTIAGSLTVTKFFGEGIGAALASAASITPTNTVHHVTGTTAINTIVAPSVAATGISVSVGLIPDGLWSTGTSGNIALASTAVVSKILWLTYDPGTTKWYPSY